MHTDIPAITGEAMAGIDRIMIEELGVDTLQLMELAGFGVAEMARHHCGLDLTTGLRIVALAGTGGNGGDAMVAVRLLHAWGADARVVLGKSRDTFSGIAARQLTILDRMGIPVHEPANHIPDADLIIDGLFGFSLKGSPRGDAATLIREANDHPAPALAIDVPSGLNATTSEIGDPCITATWTVTLALPKTGLRSAPVSITGELWLADIGVPPWVYEKTGVAIPGSLFAGSSLLRLA